MSNLKFHSESEFLPHVIKAVTFNKGSASFAKIRKYIINNVTLYQGDLEPYFCQNGNPRWFQIVRNLKSNKSFGKHLMVIPNGFALKK